MKKLLIGLMAVWVLGAQAGEITIADAWVRSAPPNARALAAFMVLRNNSNMPIQLHKVTADKIYGQVEMHRTISENGMMRMVEQAFIPVPANGEVALKPGSWHVMLIGPEQVPKEGERVHLQLEFSDGSSQEVQAVVKQGPAMMKHHH